MPKRLSAVEDSHGPKGKTALLGGEYITYLVGTYICRITNILAGGSDCIDTESSPRFLTAPYHVSVIILINLALWYGSFQLPEFKWHCVFKPVRTRQRTLAAWCDCQAL